MNSLKRQAAKAERFAAVRDELRGRLRVVLASRMALMDADQARLDEEIAALTERINDVGRGDRAAGGQPALAHRAAAMSWTARATRRRTAPTKPPSSWSAPPRASAATPSAWANWKRALPRPAAELEQTRTQLAGIAEERAQQRSFLESAAGEAREFRQKVEARQQEARTAAEEVFSAERQLESRPPPRHAPADAGRQRPQPHRAGRREPGRAGARSGAAATPRSARRATSRRTLGVESGQAHLRFESAADALKRLESEIAALRETLQTRRAEENAQRARANQLRGEQAAVAGRRDSLEALIRNHSYSTDIGAQAAEARRAGPGQLAGGHAGGFS